MTVSAGDGTKTQETQRFRLLRRTCEENGIQLQATQYHLDEDYVIRVENIMEFVPRVKFAMTPSIDETVRALNARNL